ncbi:MAG: bifunctional precorrin-2 dehydrogenase/sirohydrochlorin ferrochelatase [Clostridiales bacterium]|nr:bifunctional precorrin-2 dehydrogenase/sirohydrochlorin ferrochelatase [Clostridiales bacterium]MDY3747736.1 bifunctional precorrin-2 dehydrogenase/sirohydrochlorin ferrochelatase [Lachnospiraceae bacterium]
MPLFPMFVDMSNKNCLVFGGGAVALRKIKTLLKFGISVHVYAYAYEDELAAMIHDGTVLCEEVTVHFDGSKLPPVTGMDMVICATNHEVFNHKMAEHCKEMGIPVNSATSRIDSTFIFPAVTVRGELVIGMSTSGEVPALTKAVRETVDGAVPEWYGDLLDGLEAARKQIKKTIGSQKERQKVLKALTAYGIAHQGSIPQAVILSEIEKVPAE